VFLQLHVTEHFICYMFYRTVKIFDILQSSRQLLVKAQFLVENAVSELIDL